MKSYFHYAVFLSILLILSIAGCTTEGNSGREAIPVTVYIPEPSMISETVLAPCRLEAGSEAVVSVSVSSVVEEVLVNAGDTVIAGQSLVVLRSDDLQRASICDAAAILTAARAASEYAGGNLQRALELIETGAMSAGEFDRIETEARASEATYHQAVAAYDLSSTSARNGYVLAPFDGVVGRVIATQGSRTQGSLMSISGTETIRAQLLVAPGHIHRLKNGLPVVFVTDHFPGRVFPGSVISVSETADVVSGLVALTVQFDDTTSSLVPGLSGMAMISIETMEDVLVLPGSMMTFIDERTMEIFLVRSGTAVKQIVSTGIRNGISYEITGGVQPGDSVINLGHTLVSEGTQVRVVVQ
ncbi:MAG: efflux RND transporter periplasmic adaptor subunit [Candidatus Fermentibacteria bacterium]|nr:efflux RND transporter periplasmic adaptor subunit [Candidatus Fermentibacteria bacterium]